MKEVKIRIMLSVFVHCLKNIIKALSQKGSVTEDIEFYFDKNNKLGISLKDLNIPLFKPLYMLACPLVQTALAQVVNNKDIKYKRETIILEDTAQISLDYVLPSSQIVDKVLFVCHGLGGSSKSNYCGVLARAAIERGWAIVIYNRRGHTCDNTGAYPMHYDPNDMTRAVACATSLFPTCKTWVGVGFSLGGNLVLKYVGDYPNMHPFTAVVSIGNGLDVQNCAKKVTFVDPMADRLTVLFIADIIRYHPSLRNDAGVLQMLKKTKQFSQMDAYVMKKIKGDSFDMEKYYNDISSLHVLDKINIPSLLICSKDDPYVAGGLEHYIQSPNINNNICSIITSHGGHLAWIEGIQFNTWIDKVILDYAELVHSSKK